MPDYSACMQVTCERRSSCARYLMKSDSRWQTVASPDPANCSLFWDASKGAPFHLYSPAEADETHAATLARWRERRT